MENDPQNEGRATNNDGTDAKGTKPEFIFEHPDYEAWYPDTEKYEAEESSYWFRQNIISGFGVLFNAFTLVAAIVAACIAYNAYIASTKGVTEAKRQADEAKRQADAAEGALALTRDNFIVDQRPYIWLTNNLGAPELWNKRTDGKVQITWTFHYTNYGKTPAYKLIIESFMRLGNGPYRHPEGYVRDQYGPPLPPTKDDFSSVPSWALTPNEASQFAATDDGISIAAMITYEDALRNRYETDFCVARLQLGAIDFQPPAEHCNNQIK